MQRLRCLTNTLAPPPALHGALRSLPRAPLHLANASRNVQTLWPGPQRPRPSAPPAADSPAPRSRRPPTPHPGGRVAPRPGPQHLPAGKLSGRITRTAAEATGFGAHAVGTFGKVTESRGSRGKSGGSPEEVRGTRRTRKDRVKITNSSGRARRFSIGIAHNPSPLPVGHAIRAPLENSGRSISLSGSPTSGNSRADHAAAPGPGGAGAVWRRCDGCVVAVRRHAGAIRRRREGPASAPVSAPVGAPGG
jgi:hypothetical protein